MRLANILDPVRSKLAPRVWNSPGSKTPRLKHDLKDWIQKTVYEEFAKHGYHDAEDWLSLVFTGSLTTYQYADTSDIDVSLFVDNHKVPDWSRAELVGICVQYLDGKKFQNLPYPLQCYVVPSTLKREDLYAPGLRSGYELETDEWINPPEKERSRDVKKAQPEDYAIAIEMVDKMQLLLKHEPDKAEMLWHQIHRRRRRDQQDGKGDYSQSNIIYKALSNWGLMEQLEELTGEHIAKKSNWTTSLYSIEAATQHLGLKNPVSITSVDGTSGRYLGLHNGRHEIEVVGWLSPKSASKQIWHELAHALQRERGEQHHYANLDHSTDEYRDQPQEIEARRIADEAPFEITSGSADSIIRDTLVQDIKGAKDTYRALGHPDPKDTWKF